MIKKLLCLLVLLLTATTGAMAQAAITTDLADSYDAKVGIPITLSIEATNAQYYQWYKKLPQGDAMIMFATSSSYTFTPKEAGETKFFCSVWGYNNDYVESKVTTVIATVPQTYSITLAEGTEDAGNWIVPTEAAEGTTVTVTYSGKKKVKSVKAVKKAAVDPAKAYMKWDADQKKLVATEIPESFTTVTSSTTTWSAGTYVVEGEVSITGTIELSGDVNLIIKDGAKLTAQGISGEGKNLYIYGQANQSGQLVVGNSGTDAIGNINTLEVYSAKVEATAYGDWCCGFFGISTFNVYGGLVDAKNVAEIGCGIALNAGGSMNIYGGEVKAEGKGNETNGSYGIICDSEDKATVTVYGGKLRAVSAQKAALYPAITLQKGAGFTGKIETSDDNSAWTEYTEAATPTTKYVRVGY